MISHTLLSIILLLTTSLALSYNPSSLNATILDHNNNDVTSSFRILSFFSQQPAPLPPPEITNLTDRRRQPAAITRLINRCPLSTETFFSSRCNFKTSDPASFQAFTITCRHYPSGSSHPVISHRQGHCHSDEICVTTSSQRTVGGHPGVTVQTAACVQQSAFLEWTRPGAHDVGIQEAWAALLGLTVTVHMSAGGEEAPLEVDSLAVESQGSNGQGGRRRRCRDCVGLEWGGVPGGLDGLKAEARLLTAGAAVGTGVLWLAVMAG